MGTIRRRDFLVAAGALLGAADAFAQSTPPRPTVGQSADDNALVQRPDVKVGDRWTYIRMDYSTNTAVEAFEEQVTFIGDSVILATATILTIGKVTWAFGRRTTATPNQGGEADVSYTRDWNIVTSSDGQVFVGHSNDFAFPLFVGASYRADREYRRPLLGSFHIKYQRTAKVVRWERVVVPAGQFRALKIELSGHGQRLDQPASRSTPARWGFWYAPEVKRTVKYEFWDPDVYRGFELASFSVH